MHTPPRPRTARTPPRGGAWRAGGGRWRGKPDAGAAFERPRSAPRAARGDVRLRTV
jgi:hypothetical protein